MNLEQRHVEKGIDYLTYRLLIDTLLLQGKTTGPIQFATLTEYTKLNVVRMKRVDRTVQLITELQEVIEAIDFEQTWVVITEGWCGDAAQSLPVFYALSKLNNKINLRLLLRDENLELMNNYLTNGSLSIPKLIVTKTQNLEEIFNWGPRPAPLQTMFYELRDKGIPYKERVEQLQLWYSKDKTVTIQQELLALFKSA